MEEKKDIYILGIESSCDDTSAAVLRNGVLLSNVTASQDVHKAYGGVVPELASRAHQQNVVPVVDQAIKKAGITKEQLSAVAFTRGPGLMGSLLVGVSFAKGFARALGIPLIDVNHLQGHVMAHFIKESDDDMSAPPLPFLPGALGPQILGGERAAPVRLCVPLSPGKEAGRAVKGHHPIHPVLHAEDSVDAGQAGSKPEGAHDIRRQRVKGTVPQIPPQGESRLLQFQMEPLLGKPVGSHPDLKPLL